MCNFFYLILVLCSGAVYGQASTVEFRQGKWTDILATAKKTNKPIMLYVWSRSCSPCVEMSRDVFPNPAVSQYYNATFINYKVNRDEGIGKQLSAQYGIVSLPAYLFFNADGKPVHRTGDGKAAAAFIQDGKDSFYPEKSFFTLKERYLAGDRNPEFLYRFSQTTGLRQEGELAKQVADSYWKSLQPDEMISKKNLDFAFEWNSDFKSLMTEFFLTHQPAFVARFGQEAIAKKMRNMIGQAASDLGEKNDLTGLNTFRASLTRLVPSQAGQWQELAQIRYLLGQPQRNWPAYADATLAYGQKFATQDNYTLYEAAVYINGFVDDKAVLAKADQIIQQAIGARKSYDYLLTRAKLLHKLGHASEAATLATEAIAVAKSTGEKSESATGFLAEIKK